MNKVEEIKKKALGEDEAEDEVLSEDAVVEDTGEELEGDTGEPVEEPTEEPTEAAEEAPIAESEAEGDIDRGSEEEIQKLKEENERLKNALLQSGEAAKESIAKKAVDEDDDFDLSAFVYGSDDEKKSAKEALVRAVLSKVRNDAEDVLRQKDEAERMLDCQKAIKLLKSMEEDFPGYGEKSDIIEALIDRDDVLKSYKDPVNARIAAFLIQKGLDALSAEKKETSLDDLMELYRNNEDFKAEVEKERLKQIEETGDVPTIPLDGGYSSSSPYEAPEPPKSIKEANERVKKKFFK